MAARLIQCPLCSNPVQPRFLTKGGICPTCDDERKKWQRAHFLHTSKVEQAKDMFYAQQHKKLLQVRKDQKAKIEAQAKEKALAAERKQLKEIYKEKASIALAKTSFLHYVERYSPGYETSWAHEHVANELEQFYRAVARKESPRLVLTLPSRFGKSLLASDAGPAWALGNWPWMKFVLASYSDELPIDFSRNIRAQLQSPEFRTIFPNGAHLSKDDASVKSWSTVEDGGLRATGVGGGLLGFGAHVLCIDDPIRDMEQADNPVALEKVYDWFSSVAYSRLLPGGGIVIILQRMSHEDLVGRVIKKMKEDDDKIEELRQAAREIIDNHDSTAVEIEDAYNLQAEADELDESRDKWKILEYPALAVSDEYLNKETGEIVKVSPGVEVDSSLKPLRKVGEALHPQRYNRSYLLRLKRANPRRFAAMYMLAPAADDSAYFTQSDFKRYPEGKHPKLDHMTICCAWDQALGVKQQNDWTVGIAGGMDHKGDVYLLDIVKGKFADVRQVSDLVIDLHVKWKASITGIEKNHISMAMGPIPKDRMRERGQYIALAEGKEALTPITDKLVRARTFQGLCRSGKVYVPEGEVWDSYISTMTAFGASVHDDEVDASAWLGILLTRQPPPRNPSVVENAKEAVVSVYDRLFKRREELESTGSYMSS